MSTIEQVVTPAEEEKRGRRDRSSEEPGDDAWGAVDWAGLSSRLSAYSLASDEESETGEEPDTEDGEKD